MRNGRFYWLLILQVLILFACFHILSAELTDRCKQCTLIVDTFNAGMRKTENQHFAGGNTEWEERKLGKFAKSETRLVESLEYLCKLSSIEDTKIYSGLKDVEFKCQALAEEHEELIENWYFHKQNSDPDLLRWLCFDKLKLCCLPGHYGKDCKPCPGVDRNLLTCSGHGKCNGDGSREGTGKCKCDVGYVGFMCSNCDANYFAASQNKHSLECKECHQSCRGGCASDGPKGCKECRSGWIMNEEKGCVDVDECLEGQKCFGVHEICVNNEGSYSCECEEGYAKDHIENVCKLDVNEVNNSTSMLNVSAIETNGEESSFSNTDGPAGTTSESLTLEDSKNEL